MMSAERPAAALFSQALVSRAEALVRRCKAGRAMVATAESCTGGLVAALLTEVAGSSAVVDRGFVTYSNEAKSDMLGVPWEMLQTVGAVSAETALAMASGALGRSRASLAVAITGIAGPGGGTVDKPVGLVHFALAVRNSGPRHVACQFGSIGRLAIRLAAVEQALSLLEEGAGQV